MQRNNAGLTAPRWPNSNQQEFRNQYGVPVFHRPFGLVNRKRTRRLATAIAFTLLTGAALLFGGELVQAFFAGKLVIR